MNLPKREPLLADKFLALGYHPEDTSGVVTKAFWQTTCSNLKLAKHFVFDRQATEYCAALLKQEPRIVADAQDFAIPPFERTYIEIDFTAWYRVLAGREPDGHADIRMGYLIVKNEVRCLSESLEGVGLSPISYRLNEPFTLEEEVKLCRQLQISRSKLDLFFWAESAFTFTRVENVDGRREAHVDHEWQKEGLRSLRANHGFAFNLPPHRSLPKIWDRFYESSAGDLRNIIGLLLFLNRTSKTRYETEAPLLPGRWIGCKQATLLRHRVISFSVNPVPRLLKLAAGESIRRRLHDVRGHLCHNEVARTNLHDHEWEESEENHLRWSCSCGGLRWWRKPHMRGHEERGLVTSEYRVTE
jgi:hypothetical protein